MPLFLYFCLIYIIQLTDKVLPMLGFELRISGVRSDRSATTNALEKIIFFVDENRLSWNLTILVSQLGEVSLVLCGNPDKDNALLRSPISK